MSPLEIYELEDFFSRFIHSVHKEKVKLYFHKYDHKTNSRFEKIFTKHSQYLLSSIRKDKNFYEFTIINEAKLFEFFILKFLGKYGIHKLYVKKIKDNYKIIRIS